MIGAAYGVALVLTRSESTTHMDETRRRRRRSAVCQPYDYAEQSARYSLGLLRQLGYLIENRTISDLFAPSEYGYVFKTKETAVRAGSESVDIAHMIGQIVQDAKRVLGLTNVQIAKFAGVSRPSLYNHISGKETPKSMDGYNTISQLISRVNNEIGIEIGKGMKSFLVNGQTLQNRLTQGSYDEEEFVAAAKEVARMMASRNPSSDAIPSTVQRAVTRSLGSVG